MSSKSKKRKKARKPDTKILAARYKKEYLGHLKHFFGLLADDEAFGLLPHKELETLYKVHFAPPRIQPAHGTTMSKQLLNEMNTMFNELLNRLEIPILGGEHNISLLQYATYYITVQLYVQQLDPGHFSNAAIVLEKFRKFRDAHEEFDALAMKRFTNTLGLMGFMFSYPDKAYYCFKLEPISGVLRGRGSCLRVLAVKVKPEVKYFEMNNIDRPAMRLGHTIPQREVKWISAQVPDNGHRSNQLEVYIQPHAMHRFLERMEVIDKPFLLFNFFRTMLKPKPFYIKRSLLFPFFLGSHVVGYFTAIISAGYIVFTTFLFLTHEGTPEGEKLKEIAGLAKADVKYLHIDKLRSFIESDIKQNEAIKQMFIDAGCKGLFELEIDEPEKLTGQIGLADDIKKYIGLGLVEDE